MEWHTHTGTVNKELLQSTRLVIEVETTIPDVESSVVLVRTRAAGVLIRETSEEAALGSVPGSVLVWAAGEDGGDAKGLLAGIFSLGSGKSRGSGCSAGSEGECLKLHLDRGFGFVCRRERERCFDCQ